MSDPSPSPSTSTSPGPGPSAGPTPDVTADLTPGRAQDVTGEASGPRLVVVGLVALAALALLLLVLPAPARAETGGTGGTPPGQSWVRAGSFVPGMGTVAVEVDPVDDDSSPVTLADGAAYGDVSAYDGLPPGGYTATVRDTATDADDPVLSRTFEVGAGEARTVAVVGTTADPRLVLLTDDLTPPEPGTARVRLLSAAQTAPAVTVRAVDGPVLAENAVLGEATSYATVPAGSWTLELDGMSAASSLEDVAIAGGSVYTVVVLDAEGDGIALRVVSDAAGAATAPRGGAATGLGGTAAPIGAAAAAPAASARSTGGAALLGAVAVGVLALRVRRRTTGGRG